MVFGLVLWESRKIDHFFKSNENWICDLFSCIWAGISGKTKSRASWKHRLEYSDQLTLNSHRSFYSMMWILEGNNDVLSFSKSKMALLGGIFRLSADVRKNECIKSQGSLHDSMQHLSIYFLLKFYLNTMREKF